MFVELKIIIIIYILELQNILLCLKVCNTFNFIVFILNNWAYWPDTHISQQMGTIVQGSHKNKEFDSDLNCASPAHGSIGTDGSKIDFVSFDYQRSPHLLLD